MNIYKDKFGMNKIVQDFSNRTNYNEITDLRKEVEALHRELVSLREEKAEKFDTFEKAVKRSQKKQEEPVEYNTYSNIYKCTNGDFLIGLAFILDTAIDGKEFTLSGRKIKCKARGNGVIFTDAVDKTPLFEIGYDLSPQFHDPWCDEDIEMSEINEILRDY